MGVSKLKLKMGMEKPKYMLKLRSLYRDFGALFFIFDLELSALWAILTLIVPFLALVEMISNSWLKMCYESSTCILVFPFSILICLPPTMLIKELIFTVLNFYFKINQMVFRLLEFWKNLS